MGDPFSAVGSVLAVVGCTAETSKFLFKFLRRVPSLPRDIHQSSEALKSLQVTLSQLQRCGAQLDPEYSFSTQFTQRLHECLQQLTEWAIKMEEIDAKVAKTASVARAWEKTKWLLHGEQEMRSFLKHMRSHQSAFSIELLTLLVYDLPGVELLYQLPVLSFAAEQFTDALHLHQFLPTPSRSPLSPLL